MFSQLCTYPRNTQDRKANITKEHRGLAPKSFNIYIESKVFLYSVFWPELPLSHLPEPPYLPTLLSPYLHCLSLESYKKKELKKKPTTTNKKRHKKCIHTNKAHKSIKSEIIQVKDQWGIKGSHIAICNKNIPQNILEFILQHQNLKIWLRLIAFTQSSEVEKSLWKPAAQRETCKIQRNFKGELCPHPWRCSSWMRNGECAGTS